MFAVCQNKFGDRSVRKKAASTAKKAMAKNRKQLLARCKTEEDTLSGTLPVKPSGGTDLGPVDIAGVLVSDLPKEDGDASNPAS